jgi:hypothetical protein
LMLTRLAAAAPLETQNCIAAFGIV